jgi:hypothetical protein
MDDPPLRKEARMHPAYESNTGPFDLPRSRRLDRLDATHYELTEAYERLKASYRLMPDLPLGRALVSLDGALDLVGVERAAILEAVGL